MDNKIQIEIINRDSGDGKVHIAIGFRGGFAVKDYILNDDTHFSGNNAAFNVLFNYLRNEPEFSDAHFDVRSSSALVSYTTETEKCSQLLKSLISKLYSYDFNEEAFAEAKEKTKKLFEANYKNGAFRARLKAEEAANLNKAFSLRKLIEDIQSIDYEGFAKCVKTFVVPGNTVIYIVGNKNNMDLSEFLQLFEGKDLDNSSVRIAGIGFNPYLRRDSHVMNIARTNINVIVDTVDFLNADATNFTKRLILEILASGIANDKADISVDSLDASIICETPELYSFKPELLKVSEEKYEEAKKKVLTKYFSLLENDGLVFAMTAAEMLLSGIYIDQLISYIGSMNYDEYTDIYKQADCKICEAQVVLRKAGK